MSQHTCWLSKWTVHIYFYIFCKSHWKIRMKNFEFGHSEILTCVSISSISNINIQILERNRFFPMEEKLFYLFLNSTYISSFGFCKFKVNKQARNLAHAITYSEYSYYQFKLIFVLKQ